LIVTFLAQSRFSVLPENCVLRVEAGVGIEPAYTDLQWASVIFPLS
jgi:hypothetical protein